MNRELVRQVWLRAGNRCEYCQLAAQFYPGVFSVDHIIARQHRGASELSNLALCCLHCNARKGPNIAGIDPLTGELTRLYHPRDDAWLEHFAWIGDEIAGISAVGRTTIFVLGMNEPDFMAVRAELSREGNLGGS